MHRKFSSLCGQDSAHNMLLMVYLPPYAITTQSKIMVEGIENLLALSRMRYNFFWDIYNFISWIIELHWHCYRMTIPDISTHCISGSPEVVPTISHAFLPRFVYTCFSFGEVDGLPLLMQRVNCSTHHWWSILASINKQIQCHNATKQNNTSPHR